MVFIIVGSTSSTGRTGLYDLKEDNSLIFLKALGCEDWTNATWMVPFQNEIQAVILSTDEAKGVVRVHEVIWEESSVDVKLRSSVISGGKGTTHLTLVRSTGERALSALIASNYDSGSVSVLKLNLPTAVLQSPSQIIDHNLHRRALPAHAHQCVISNGVAHVCDLGHDKIYSYAMSTVCTDHILSLQGEYCLPAGSGPRHLVVDRAGAWAYVLNELSSTVAAVRVHPDTYLLASSDIDSDDISRGTDSSRFIFSTLPMGVSPTDMAGAAILLSDDGRFLYVSNRDVSPDTASDLASDRSSISVFAIGDNGSSLQLIQTASARGRHPRHMTFVTHTKTNAGMVANVESVGELTETVQTQQVLLVANKDSQNFAVFPLDARTGQLLEGDAVVSACDPLCRFPGFVMPL